MRFFPSVKTKRKTINADLRIPEPDGSGVLFASEKWTEWVPARSAGTDKRGIIKLPWNAVLLQAEYVFWRDNNEMVYRFGYPRIGEILP